MLIGSRMSVRNAILHNLRNLTRFTGRETRSEFWPYATLVFVPAMVAIIALMLPEMIASIERMQQFASEHPELASVEAGPGGYSIRIEGYHPELMPSIGRMMIGIDIVVVIIIALLAAAVARRLHDREKSAFWGLLPIPFVAVASFLMPKLFASPEFQPGLFAALFVNNLIYLGSLVYLIVLLAGGTKEGSSTVSGGS
jgi:uncharacterized membrane protein YhaH (DUF805 family)